MIRPIPVWRILAVLGAASLILTACGGDDDDSAGGGASPSSTLPAGDGTLTLGTLLPQTGDLAFLGPPEFAGVHLAVKEINEAGGVLGKPIKESDKDSGDDAPDVANPSVDSLLNEKADAIIGAAASGVTLNVIDKVAGAGVVQFSPANTSDKLSTYPDKGFYFRTAPPDVLQGRVLADLIAQDGHSKIAIIARQDAYGTGLADNTEKFFTEGGGEVVAKQIYGTDTTNFASVVGAVKAKKPDAIALIAFNETQNIVPELVKQGLANKTAPWYFVDGNLSNSYKFPKGTLDGAKGTLPGAESPEAFQQALLAVDPKLEDFSYAPESYDAANLIAIAAQAAKNDTGAAIKSQLINVSKGGEKCTDFKSCKALLDAGKDIDYDGKSGPVEFNDVGDPAVATVGIYQYGADNTYKNIDYLTGNISG
jgi:ABC-type branched-subunit amino acid transport system substrate-binding protein